MGRQSGCGQEWAERLWSPLGAQRARERLQRARRDLENCLQALQAGSEGGDWGKAVSEDACTELQWKCRLARGALEQVWRGLGRSDRVELRPSLEHGYQICAQCRLAIHPGMWAVYRDARVPEHIECAPEEELAAYPTWSLVDAQTRAWALGAHDPPPGGRRTLAVSSDAGTGR